jgi:mRNA-degrading endonuclease toxin of MazEF toxin-antitoxin module
MSVARGDVVILDFPQAPGRPPKRRPAVVVQSDQNNGRLTNSIVPNGPARPPAPPLKSPARTRDAHGSRFPASRGIFDGPVNCAATCGTFALTAFFATSCGKFRVPGNCAAACCLIAFPLRSLPTRRTIVPPAGGRQAVRLSTSINRFLGRMRLEEFL